MTDPSTTPSSQEPWYSFLKRIRARDIVVLGIGAIAAVLVLLLAAPNDKAEGVLCIVFESKSPICERRKSGDTATLPQPSSETGTESAASAQPTEPSSPPQAELNAPTVATEPTTPVTVPAPAPEYYECTWTDENADASSSGHCTCAAGWRAIGGSCELAHTSWTNTQSRLDPEANTWICVWRNNDVNKKTNNQHPKTVTKCVKP
jgi:hypothetical protein